MGLSEGDAGLPGGSAVVPGAGLEGKHSDPADIPGKSVSFTGVYVGDGSVVT